MKKKRVLILFLLLFLFFPFLVFAQVRAYRATSVQSIPNTTNTIVQLNAENYDVNDEFDNFRYTAKKAGYYLIIAQLHYVSMADGKVVIVGIRKNGVPIGETYAHTGVATDQHTIRTDIQYLEAEDYIQVYAWHNNGTAIDLAVGSALTFLAIHNITSMPDIYTLIQNATTDAEFFLNKSLSYGDILIIFLILLFLIFGIVKSIFKFIFK